MTRRNHAPAAVGIWILVTVALGAAGVWETKPFNSWSDSELKEVMANSPWVGKASLTHARAGGAARPIDDTVIATWTSALPIRQAVVRERVGIGGAVPREMEAFLAEPQPLYVIALKVQGMSAMAARGVEEIQKASTLNREGKAPIGAAQVEANMLDKDGKLAAPPQAPVPGGDPGQRGGGFGGAANANAAAMIVIGFPRDSAITMADKEVELVTRIGQYNVKRKFKLKDMAVNGVLEL